MTRPTDAELEAMAARLCVPWDADRSTVSQTIHWMKERREAAAMLRACKAGDAEWDEIIQAAEDAAPAPAPSRKDRPND